MLGMEISVNNMEPLIAASDNLVFASLTYGYSSSDQIAVLGSDLLHYFTWFKGEPEKGDKVKIRIVEADNVSPTIATSCRDKDEIIRRYEELKAELEKKGLI